MQTQNKKINKIVKALTYFTTDDKNHNYNKDIEYRKIFDEDYSEDLLLSLKNKIDDKSWQYLLYNINYFNLSKIFINSNIEHIDIVNYLKKATDITDDKLVDYLLMLKDDKFNDRVSTIKMFEIKKYTKTWIKANINKIINVNLQLLSNFLIEQDVDFLDFNKYINILKKDKLALYLFLENKKFKYHFLADNFNILDVNDMVVVFALLLNNSVPTSYIEDILMSPKRIRNWADEYSVEHIFVRNDYSLRFLNDFLKRRAVNNSSGFFVMQNTIHTILSTQVITLDIFNYLCKEFDKVKILSLLKKQTLSEDFLTSIIDKINFCDISDSSFVDIKSIDLKNKLIDKACIDITKDINSNSISKFDSFLGAIELEDKNINYLLDKIFNIDEVYYWRILPYVIKKQILSLDIINKILDVVDNNILKIIELDKNLENSAISNGISVIESDKCLENSDVKNTILYIYSIILENQPYTNIVAKRAVDILFIKDSSIMLKNNAKGILRAMQNSNISEETLLYIIEETSKNKIFYTETIPFDLIYQIASNLPISIETLGKLINYLDESTKSDIDILISTLHRHHGEKSKDKKIAEMKKYAKKYDLKFDGEYLYAFRSHNLNVGVFKKNIRYRKNQYYRDWRCNMNDNDKSSYGLGIWPSGNVSVKVSVDDWGLALSNESGKCRVWGFTILDDNIDA